MDGARYVNTVFGREIGLVSDYRWHTFEIKKYQYENELLRLQK